MVICADVYKPQSRSPWHSYCAKTQPPRPHHWRNRRQSEHCKVRCGSQAVCFSLVLEVEGAVNTETADKPQVLLEHHLKMLRLPTFLREYESRGRHR
jgi:hypothetical protein